MYACTRLDYDGSVRIREMKRIAEERGIRPSPPGGGPEGAGGTASKVAIIGAGPAGLSAAYFLNAAGVPVTVFEKAESAGGIVGSILPKFRIPREALERDIEYIRSGGAKFRFGAGEVDPSFLKSEGFEIIIVAVGAGQSSRLELPGRNTRVVPSLEFLTEFNRADPTELDPGRRVAVIGGGNTAMDSARAAGKLPGVESVTVLYRRTEAQMPADREEYEEALAEGIEFKFLRAPVRFDPDGTLTVEVMELGEEDDSGRPKPLSTGRTETFTVDTVVTAIGERPDPEVLSRFGIPAPGNGGKTGRTAEYPMEAAPGVYLIGDARTGPSTVVECIAEGREAADAVLRNLSGADDSPSRQTSREDRRVPASRAEAKAAGLPAGEIPTPVLADVRDRRTEAVPGSVRFEAENEVPAAKGESRRCLECGFFCGKCVEVCPNRANLALPFPGFRDEYQIIHLDGACNECGNCDTFCPWDGKPYTDKFTVFRTMEDFEASENSGLVEKDGEVRVRIDGSEYRWPADSPLPDEKAERIVRELVGRYRFLY
jgi:putative selenate reductase